MGGPILYITVAFIAALFASGSQKTTRWKINGRFRPVFFWCSFLVLCGFIGYTDTGADYYAYHRIIEANHTFNALVEDVNTEPLFTLWSTILWPLCKNAHIIIFSMKACSALLIFYSFYLLREKIDVFLSILAYISITYFMSFFLISINLASACLCLAFALLLMDKDKIGIVVAFAACGFHYSAFLAILPIIAYKFMFMNSGGRTMNKGRLILVILVAILFSSVFFQIVSSFIENYEQFEHYNKYLESMNSNKNKGSGIMQFVFYAPIVYTIIYMYKDKFYSRRIYILGLFYAVMGFISAELGYMIAILDRSYFIFFPLFGILLPYYSASLKDSQVKKGFLTAYQFRVVVVLYLLFRMYMTFREHIQPGDTSEMYEYHYFNPFI